jgi:hypothetical protein
MSLPLMPPALNGVNGYGYPNGCDEHDDGASERPHEGQEY